MKTNQKLPSTNGRWAVAIVILILLMITSLFSALIIGFFIGGTEIEPTGNVALIRITGPIMSYSPGSFMSDDVASSTDLVRLIEKADARDDIKAILFEINSGGGTVVASYELAEAIANTNKTTVAWIREVGASGAYWAATETDHIVANPMSITGSIGVIASYIEIGGLLNKYNASYQRLVSGDYKDMGTPLRRLTDDEEAVMQTNLDTIRDYFVRAVAENRNLPIETVDEVADGRYYLGVQASDLELIDELGGKEQAISYIEDTLDIEAEIAVYERPKSFFDALAGVSGDFSFNIGRGMGSSLTENSQQGAGMRI